MEPPEARGLAKKYCYIAENAHGLPPRENVRVIMAGLGRIPPPHHPPTLLRWPPGRRFVDLSARSLSQLAVLVLAFVGLLAVGSRYQARKVTQAARADSLWQLSYDVSFEADPQVGEQESSALIHLGRPYPMAHLEILGEVPDDSNPSLKLEWWESNSSGNREFRYETRHAGNYQVSAVFKLRLRSGDTGENQGYLESLSQYREGLYTQSERDFPINHPSVAKVLQSLPDDEATQSERLEQIYQFCLRDLRPATEPNEGDQVLWAIERKTSPLGRAKVFVTLCRAIDIPARLVVGFELRHSDVAVPHVWAEVHRDNRWIPFDPVTGFTRRMPREFVPIRRGGASIVRPLDNQNGIKNVVAKYRVLRLESEPEVLQAEASDFTDVFDLKQLPVPMHDILSLMLLLPFGALITAVFRNLVGLRTLGTFAPALLAMSFIYSAGVTGVVILIVVVITGLLGRWLLERLHLLMVPRLSIVLTVIILCVVFAVSLVNYFSLGQTTQSVLIPLVILTILIERVYVTIEEDSTGYAIQLVLGTVVVAAFCYLLLRWDYVGNLVLEYPEIHFLTIAAFVLIGRYSGYRLTELWRFRDLVKQEHNEPQPPAT